MHFTNKIFFSFGSDAFIMGSILETLSIGLADEYSLEKVRNKNKN
jgi:hypothetical protein